jgi:hypothetical protein
MGLADFDQHYVKEKQLTKIKNICPEGFKKKINNVN